MPQNNKKFEQYVSFLQEVEESSFCDVSVYKKNRNNSKWYVKEMDSESMARDLVATGELYRFLLKGNAPKARYWYDEGSDTHYVALKSVGDKSQTLYDLEENNIEISSRIPNYTASAVVALFLAEDDYNNSNQSILFDLIDSRAVASNMNKIDHDYSFDMELLTLPFEKKYLLQINNSHASCFDVDEGFFDENEKFEAVKFIFNLSFESIITTMYQNLNLSLNLNKINKKILALKIRKKMFDACALDIYGDKLNGKRIHIQDDAYLKVYSEWENLYIKKQKEDFKKIYHAMMSYEMTLSKLRSEQNVVRALFEVHKYLTKKDVYLNKIILDLMKEEKGIEKEEIFLYMMRIEQLPIFTANPGSYERFLQLIEKTIKRKIPSELKKNNVTQKQEILQFMYVDHDIKEKYNSNKQNKDILNLYNLFQESFLLYPSRMSFRS